MITVIIPAYCHGHLIHNSIESVIAQTFKCWELIIINDGSPDNTAESIQPFLADERIHYYEQANQGQSAARNFGLSVSNGAFIHLLDDDDWLPADALEWQIAFLNTNPEYSAIIGSASFVVGEGNVSITPAVKEGDISFYDLFSGNSFASPGQALFRKAVFDKLGGFNPTLRGVDDYDFMFRLTQTERVRSTNRVGLFYRCHRGNASNDKVQMLVSSMRIVTKNLATISDVELRRSMMQVARGAFFSYAGKGLLKSFINQPLNASNAKGLLLCLYFFPQALLNIRFVRFCCNKILGIFKNNGMILS